MLGGANPPPSNCQACSFRRMLRRKILRRISSRRRIFFIPSSAQMHLVNRRMRSAQLDVTNDGIVALLDAVRVVNVLVSSNSIRSHPESSTNRFVTDRSFRRSITSESEPKKQPTDLPLLSDQATSTQRASGHARTDATFDVVDQNCCAC